MSQTARLSLPPLTATRIRSDGVEHGEAVDRFGGLIAAELQKVLSTEVRGVAADIDDGWPSAPDTSSLASRDDRPDLDTAWGLSILSAGTSVPSSMTRCDSRFRSSRSSSAETVIGPSISSSGRIAEVDLHAEPGARSSRCVCPGGLCVDDDE